MTDPKSDIDKFDPTEWEICHGIDLSSALLLMLNGETVYNVNLSAYYRRYGQEWLVWINRLHGWSKCYLGATTESRAHDNGGWRAAVRKPKPEPVKPAEPTSDDILNALRYGKRVVDADGDEVALFWLEKSDSKWYRGADCIPLPMTIKPEPKPRRRVTREEAIIAMVKDPELVVWREDRVRYRWAGSRIVLCACPSQGCDFTGEIFYLDPPEAT